GHTGFDLFLNVQQANGVFVTSTAPTNTGTGVIDIGTVTVPADWVPHTHTLRFNDPPDTWEVVDSGNNVVATGPYVADGSISFNGIQVSVSGEPAAGDEFIISPANTEDMFTTLANLAATLRTSTATPTERAR